MTTLYVDNIAPNLQSKISAPNLTLPTGSVIQVVQGTTTTPASTTSTTFLDSGLSVTITPTSSSSKILVMSDFGTSSGDSTGGMVIQLLRGSTALFYRGVSYKGGTTVIYNNASLNHLDSPSTTSATTYKVQYKTQTSSSTSIINPSYGGFPNPTAHIIAMEIAG